jgi:outer membrane protein OmpA-like peptidoglycan-associated protein/tetratricopeptide (TPR) repeat protein
MKKSIILISIISFFSLNGISQSSSIKKANKLYNAKLYFQAIPKYNSILKNDSASQEVLTNLADCYRLTNNNKGQIYCYEKLVSLGKIEDLQKLYYGQALMGDGRYEDAKTFLDEFKSDNRGSEFSKAIINIENFLKNKDAYKVDTVNFNSNDDDFSAIPFLKNNVVFASSKTKTAWINRKHGWTGKNYCNMYITEGDTTGNFKKPQLFLKEYATKFNDGPFCATKDGQTIFFTRNSFYKKDKSIDGSQKLQLFQASIISGEVQSLLKLKFNSSEFNCAHPAISADGKTLYFSSDMGGGKGGMDLWYCKQDAAGAWETPINLGDKINTQGNEIFPFITQDNLLYFASTGHGGLGGLDVFEVKLKENIAFSKVYNMGSPINTINDDFAYNLFEDGNKAFLSSNRKTGGMNDDIYLVSVLRKVIRGKIVNIIVKDKFTQEVLPLTKLQLNADTFLTNDKGEYQATIEDDVNYNIVASREKYFTLNDSVSTKSSKEEFEFTKTLELVKDFKLSLLAGIYDARTGVGIEGVKITIKDVSQINSFELIKTEKNGEYRKLLTDKKVGDKLQYIITIEKEDYLTKTLTFEYEIKKEGEIQLNELLGLTIGKVEVGVDIAKMIDVKPIYFDLGKSIIREDGKIELNKIVSVMKEYPNIVIELGSYTDCRGSLSSNLRLSERRAEASSAYIIKTGINKNRITYKGYGESKLLNSCECEGDKTSTCSEEEHAKNRRTEFVIVKIKK